MNYGKDKRKKVVSGSAYICYPCSADPDRSSSNLCCTGRRVYPVCRWGNRKNLVEAGSFHYVESAPVSFFSIPSLIYRAIVKAASTVTFILIIGGSFEIITSTGVLTVLCKKMSKAFKGREFFVIPAFLVLFSIFGATMGMSTEVMIFVRSELLWPLHWDWIK